MLNRILKLGLLCTLLMTLCCGCSVEDTIVSEVKYDITQRLKMDRDFRGVTVTGLTVTHLGGNEYAGKLGVLAKGRNLTLDVDITYDEGFLTDEFQWEISASEMQKLAEILD